MSNSSTSSGSNRESLDSFKTPDINSGDRLDILRRANDEPNSYPTPPSESLTNDDDAGSNSCSDENLYNMSRLAMANYPVNQFRSEFEIKNLLASARPPLLPIISPSNSVSNFQKMEQYLQSQYELQTCKNDAIKFPITNICQIPPPDLASIEAAEANNRMNQSKRRTRTKFTKQQLDILEATFEKQHYPDVNVVDRLSDLLKLATERISIWFQNRRARYKKIKKNEPMRHHDHHIESRESLNSSITSTSNGYCDSSESGSFTTHVVPHERGAIATRYNNNNNIRSRREVKQEPKLDDDEDTTEEEDSDDKVKEVDSDNQNQFKFETLQQQQQQYDASNACKSPVDSSSSTTTTTDINNQTTTTTTSAQSPSNNDTYSEDEDDKESVVSSQQMTRSASSLSIKTGADNFYSNPFLQGIYPSSNGLLSLASISQQQQNQMQNAYPGYNFPTSAHNTTAFQSPYMPFPYYQNYQNPTSNASYNAYNQAQSFHPGLFQPYAAAAAANYPSSTIDTYNTDNQTYPYNYQQPTPTSVAYTD